MSTPENPDYITISCIFDIWHINLMRYDKRDDCYRVVRSDQIGDGKSEQVTMFKAVEMATKMKLEYKK